VKQPRLRVMTYNIRSGRGADDRVDLGRIADVIASYQPDLVALQEVDCGRERSGSVDQAAALGEQLAMNASFAPCITDGGARYGIATLSRLPVVTSRQVELPHRANLPRSEPRCALLTRLAAGEGRTIDLVNTHLSVRRGERPAQVAAIGSALDERDDLILAGDLNCTFLSGPFRSLCTGLRPATRRARSWPARLPIVQIDHILYRGSLAVVTAGAWTAGPARQASDHLPVVAELALEEARA
jgi:endonuclease/exonuclease/phosphatase family metal-dependent hydrolase